MSGPGVSALAAADRVLRTIEFATVVIAGIVIFFVMWVGVAEIFSRKLFNYPLYGQLDLIELTMSSYAILPISYCWRAAGHIRVDLMIDRFEGRRRWFVELLTTRPGAGAGDGDLAGCLPFLRQCVGHRGFDHQHAVADLAVEIRSDHRVFHPVAPARDRDGRVCQAGD